jgi:serine/threonine protein kinase
MRFEHRILLDFDEKCNPIDEKNKIIWDEGEYYVRPLTSNYQTSKGGNSSVYSLTNNYDKKYAIKFSNYPRPTNRGENSKGYSRFLNEIEALKEANEHDFPNIIKIITDGTVELKGREYPYIIMEKADTDLKEYLLNESSIDDQQKFILCKEIFKAVKDLHSIEIYHRDIKPDNILLFTSEDKLKWKIADLGLIKYRGKDFDEIGEKIGPLGWLSPEATNKFLTEKSNIEVDCEIDRFSDIFMLGELFWFVFKLNIPIGQIIENDFGLDFPESDLYFSLIKSMLSHSKVNRTNLEDIEFFLTGIGKSLMV